MILAQKKEEQKELSNISEEKSDIHNISSIRSSKMIHMIRQNQPKCFICKCPNNTTNTANTNTNNNNNNMEEINLASLATNTTKHQNILIYPCLCNILAHRYCMKQYILTNHITSCKVCGRDYAVGKIENDILKQIPPYMISSCLCKLFGFFIIVLAIILIMIYINNLMNQDNDNIINTWKTILIVLLCIVILMIIMHGICMLRISLNNLKLLDIELYCYQTEIAYHCKNPKEILKNYLENIQDNNAKNKHNQHHNNNHNMFYYDNNNNNHNNYQDHHYKTYYDDHHNHYPQKQQLHGNNNHHDRQQQQQQYYNSHTNNDNNDYYPNQDDDNNNLIMKYDSEVQTSMSLLEKNIQNDMYNPNMANHKRNRKRINELIREDNQNYNMNYLSPDANHPTINLNPNYTNHNTQNIQYISNPINHINVAMHNHNSYLINNGNLQMQSRPRSNSQSQQAQPQSQQQQPCQDKKMDSFAEHNKENSYKLDELSSIKPKFLLPLQKSGTLSPINIHSHKIDIGGEISLENGILDKVIKENKDGVDINKKQDNIIITENINQVKKSIPQQHQSLDDSHDLKNIALDFENIPHDNDNFNNNNKEINFGNKSLSLTITDNHI